jgi:hypothetical protein
MIVLHFFYFNTTKIDLFNCISNRELTELQNKVKALLNDKKNRLKNRNLLLIKFLKLNKGIMKNKDLNPNKLKNDLNLKYELSGRRLDNPPKEITSKTYTDVEIDLNGYPKIVQKTILSYKSKPLEEDDKDIN